MMGSLIGIAQFDKSSCPASLSIFAEFAKVKNYDSAYQPWLEVRNNCPELNVATFKYGERILNHKIKKLIILIHHTNYSIQFFVDAVSYQSNLIFLYHHPQKTF